MAKSPEATVAEAENLYKEKISSIAKTITNNSNIKLILLAGPSGSGKTTTANLLRDAIESLGERAMVVSLDDFYRAQTDPEYPKLENGEYDYESPDALDLCKLSFTLSRIVSSKRFEIPRYDFKIGAPSKINSYPPIERGCVIIEGLHALNPRISDSLPHEQVLKIFVSVSTNVNEGENRIISGKKIRFVRRLVRDSIYRGATAERTLSLWRLVLAAEDIYLYPYKETADIAFDTFHSFELSAMKHYAKKLLSNTLCECEPYARIVSEALDKIIEIDPSIIPESSLIREFIPGGIYEALY